MPPTAIWGKVASSLALRVGAPVALGTLGAAVENCSGEMFCSVAGAAIHSATVALVCASIDRSSSNRTCEHQVRRSFEF